jgi:hypothetical protein
MTEAQLIQEIQNEIQLSCALPYALPPAEVVRIINRAKEWFWVNYQWAVEEKLMSSPLEIFQHPTFKSTRMIQLPDCIISVYELREVTGVGIIGTPDRDFSDSKLLGAEIFLSPFQGDNLVYRTAMYSYFDLARAYTLETVAYKYNRNTKRISVLGRNPFRNCFIRVAAKIPDDTLYDDEIFVRYCLAQAKINLGRILQLFNYNLPGGINVNFDATKQDGLTEMTEIKAQIDGENTADWFIQWN